MYSCTEKMRIKTFQNIFIVFLVLLFERNPISAQTHAGLSFHYSLDTKLGLYADIHDRVVLELRVIDFSLLLDTPFELYGFYKIINKNNYELYSGLGYGFSAFESYFGIIGAVGVNLYPFENKKLGFHIELNPIKGDFSPLIIRGSWGMRYTFDWSEEEQEELFD